MALSLLSSLAWVACSPGTSDDEPPPFEEAALSARCVRTDAPEPGAIWGHVAGIDSAAVEGAQIYIPGLGICGTLSDSAGRYLLEAVPSGTHTVVFTLIGYHVDSTEVTVEADTAYLFMQLEPMKVQLDDMIVRPETIPPESAR